MLSAASWLRPGTKAAGFIACVMKKAASAPAASMAALAVVKEASTPPI
jgi:hypothetical protein